MGARGAHVIDPSKAGGTAGFVTVRHKIQLKLRQTRGFLSIDCQSPDPVIESSHSRVAFAGEGRAEAVLRAAAVPRSGVAAKRFVTAFSHDQPLPYWWRALFEASGNGSIFLSPAWMQAWIATYGVEFEGRWLRWESEGRVVAGCLLLERVIRVKCIPLRSQFLNATGHATPPTPLAEFNDVLCLPGHAEGVAADLAALLQEQRWSRLLLCGHEHAGIAARTLARVGGLRTEQVAKTARYVDLAALAGRPFEATLTGKAGTHVRRNRREYETRLGAVEVRRAEGLAQTLEFFEQMRALHLQRWSGRDKPTSLAADVVVGFHRRLIAALHAHGGIEMIRVGTAGRAIGFLYNFIEGGKVFVFQTGFAYEASSKWSPGLLTHALAIEHYRARGLREYDLLSGDALYKRTLCNGERELLWTTVYRDRPWIRLLLAGRRLRDRFRNAPPAPAQPA